MTVPPVYQDADIRFLRRRRRPDYERGARPVRIVDLFAGCGGMSLGLAEAARRAKRSIDVRLAVDFDDAAAAVYRDNFSGARVECRSVEDLFPGEVGAKPLAAERSIQRDLGPVDILLGGPPCQGHSDLNNHTRRLDARNELYLVMARAAELLEPSAVLIENVPAAAHDKGRVVQRTADHLRELGYLVEAAVIDAYHLGVPQHRRRHLLVATRPGMPNPAGVLELLSRGGPTGRSLRWAFDGLDECGNGDRLHHASAMSPENERRAAWLVKHGAFELPDRLRPICHRAGGHSYKSVYGRLRWDSPAQTITTGFTSMGQGRYLHPKGDRTLTPREAARLQFFPDFFDFTSAGGRTAWARLIGNAVPPKLTLAFGQQVIPYLSAP